MKIVLSFFSILLAFISLSQNLHEKISQDAVAVFGLNGEQILQKVSLSELSSSPLYDELMKRHYSGGDLELIGGLEDFGIDYTKAIYYVEETGNEEVDFSFLCYHIKDLSVFENTVKTKMVYKEFEQNGDINIITYSYYNKLFWNSQFAILIVGETRKNNYYSSDYYDYGNYGNEETIYYEVEVAEEDPMDTLTLEDLENMTDEQWQAYLDEQEALQKQREEEEQKYLEEKEKQKEEKREMKERTISNAIQNRAIRFFSDELKTQGNNLKADFDQEADAHIYYSGNMSFSDLLPGRRSSRIFSIRNWMEIGNFSGDFSANFYLRTGSVDMEASFKYPEKLQDIYAGIFNSKINKKYINFIGADDLGYVSYAVNSEEIWKAYPKTLAYIMGLEEERYEEEWRLMADVISLVVDEEALAKAFTGDMVFIFNGLSVKNVTYTSWEYDEEYNYNSIEQTKEELVPDFTVIFGSQEEELINKIFRLSVKNNALHEVDGGYQSAWDGLNRNSDLFVGYKNDMVVFTTTHEKLLEFNSGGAKNKLPKDLANDIKKNNCAMYLNSKALMQGLMNSEEFKGDDRGLLHSFKEDLTDIRATVYYSNGLMRINGTSQVPSKYKNGAEYLLQLIGNGLEALKN